VLAAAYRKMCHASCCLSQNVSC